MPITTEHYVLIRQHFLNLFGNECCLCGSPFNLEIHHKEGFLNDLTGNSRGREKRMWNWFTSYENNNLSVLCHECHNKYHICNIGVD